MGRKQLVREAERTALARMEDAARSKEDFNAVVVQWNRLDRNNRRRVRAHEIGRANEEMLHWDKVNPNNEKGKLRTELDVAIPAPLGNYRWRQQMRGDFLELIYDSAYEMWQLIEDHDISSPVKNLSEKQKEVLFLRAVRLCTAARIACCHGKTDRAVRKTLAAALDSIRGRLAPVIREQIKAGYQEMTPAKREFLEWYTEKNRDKKTNSLDENGSE